MSVFEKLQSPAFQANTFSFFRLQILSEDPKFKKQSKKRGRHAV
jgi:hypothetical protein